MDTKLIEEKAKEFADFGEYDTPHVSTRISAFTAGYKADREDVVRVIEDMQKQYAAEIDLDMLTAKGIANNETRIKVLATLLTHLNLNS